MNPPLRVAAEPSATFATTTSFGPAPPAGVTAVIEVEVTAVTVAAAPPTVTVASISKSVPVIVIVVPPVVVPVFGAMPVIVGFNTDALAADKPVAPIASVKIAVNNVLANLVEGNDFEARTCVFMIDSSQLK